MTRARAPLLVGPMRPLVAGGSFDPAFHTFEVLSAASLGVSYDAPSRAVLVPMEYEHGRTKAPDERASSARVDTRRHEPDRVVHDDARRVRARVVRR